ncbi:glycosyltransferase family 2 protein [Kordia sp.]|uniref:glycosyltransferase family 2 protein n=1 Tax=Kordia sp. TaxID=1965332 RepID=UPI003D26CBC9
MNVAIIIVTYNGISWLSTCLDSCGDVSVIVIDNNSSDNTVEFIKENYPKVTLIESSENKGFGAANNIGIAKALEQGAEYFFLLNQDAYLQPNTISRLIEVHKKDSNYGILSPIHLNGDWSKLDHNFSKYINENKELQYDAIKLNYQQSIYEVPFINAAGWLISKQAIDTVGGFDPIFFHYAEDNNYCQRIRFHGLKIGVVPDVFLAHDREYRTNTTKPDIQKKLQLEERKIKVALADLNKDLNSQLQAFRKKYANNILKSLLRLKFSDYTYHKKEQKLFAKLLPEIKKSRAINEKKGRHYISTN